MDNSIVVTKITVNKCSDKFYVNLMYCKVVLLLNLGLVTYFLHLIINNKTAIHKSSSG